ncbi:MAG TPA: cytochrome c biogenesis protein DipZ [Candidatus Udaeobacter sp.]|nr:cytochrome c biogenesis protein DipZ [Candidatus Udaeobacter sp.]
MLVLAGFAFLSGLVTILAPCIWPLLPIVLSSAVAGGGKRRPLGITLGLVISFSIATLALSALVKLFNFDPNYLRLVAVIILAILGLVMIFPFLSRYLELGISRLSSYWGRRGQNVSSGFWAGFITGLSLGIVWAPCAGPILAAVATLSITGKVSWSVAVVTIAYALGTGLPLFVIATGGQKIIGSVRFFSKYTGRIQQIFGVILILSALAIYSNYDKLIELSLLDRFPALSQSIRGFEDNQAVTDALNKLRQPNSNSNTSAGSTSSLSAIPTEMSYLFNVNYPAPEIAGISNWLNPNSPVTIKSLRGKVVLVDFWTYSCINCIRTLPFVTSWYDKYKDQGLVVLGIHTPEFEFEKDAGNVAKAIRQFKIHYPVAQDNTYGTWEAFNNQYWPAEYLIDAEGNVRRTHFGEGEYDQMEKAIQVLLVQTGKTVSDSLASMPDQTPTEATSPESYLGAERAQYFYPDRVLYVGSKVFSLPDSQPVNSFSFGGSWKIEPTSAVASAGASLVYHFQADKVYLVLNPPRGGSGKVKVYLDGKLVDSKNAGVDVKNGVMMIDSDRLYNLVDLHGFNGEHVLRLEFETPGIEAFAFTFG